MIEYDNTFSAPILKVVPENSKELCKLLVEWTNKLENEDTEGGILSEKWSAGERAKSSKDYKKGGYTSFYSKNIFEIEELRPLHEAAIRAFMSYNVGKNIPNEGFLDHAWVSSYHTGHFVPRHIHPNSHLSCVFYGDSDGESGSIKFTNPLYDSYGMLFDREVNPFFDYKLFKPEKGSFYIFPSFIPHETEKHMGKEKRIIYSSNYIFLRSRLGKNMWNFKPEE